MQLVRIGRSELLAKASNYLERARMIAPDRTDVRERLLMVSLVTGQREQARQAALFLFRKRKEMEDPYGAEQVFQAYLKVFPDSMEILEELWNLYQELGEKERGVSWLFQMVSAAETEGALDRAERLLKRLLQWDPGNAHAQEALLGIHERQGMQEKVAQESLRLAASLRQQGKREGALALYRKVVETAGEDRAVLEQVAEAYAELDEKAAACQLYLRLGAPEEEDDESRGRALAMLEKARALRPAQEEIYHRMASLHLAGGNHEKAAEVYRTLCAAAQEENDKQKLRRALDKLVEVAPDDHEAARKQIALLMSLGDTDEGIQGLHKRIATARESGDWAGVRELVVDAVELRPEDTGMWKALFESHREEGHREDVESLVSRRAALFRVEGHPEKAVELVGSAIESGFDSVRLIELLATAKEDVGDMRGAQEEYENLARRFREEGSPEQAFATLERCLSISPDRCDVLEKLVNLAEEEGQAEQAARWEKRLITELADGGRQKELLEWLEERVNREPERLDLSRRLVQEAAITLSREKLAPLVIGHLERVERVDPGEMGAEIDRMLDRLDLPDMLEWCVSWARQSGERERERELLLRLAAAAEEEGELTRAQELIERVITLAPESLEARETLVRLLDTPGMDAELTTALLAYAHLLVEQERPLDAVPVYRRALAVSEAPREVLFELVDLLARVSNKDEATAECMRWISAHQEDDPEDLIRVYEKARSLDPGNTHLLQEYARYLERSERAPRAAECYQELGNLYLERELPDRAIESLRRAKHLVSDSPELMEQLIDLFESEGMVRALCRELETLAEFYEGRGEKDPAARTKKRLDDLRKELSPGIAPASVSEEIEDTVEFDGTETGEEESAPETGESVEPAASGDVPDAPRDLEVPAEDAGDAPSGRALAESMEKAGRTEEAAELYERTGRQAREEGDLDGAARCLSSAMHLRGDNLEIMTELGELEIQRGNQSTALELFQQVAERAQRHASFDQAAEMYLRMLELGCTNLAVYTGLAWSLAKAGRDEEAAQRFVQYARMLEEKGLPEEAISAYRKAVSLSPQNNEARECLVRLFETSGRGEEAIEEKVQLANTLCAADEFEGALDILQGVLRSNPKALTAREALITVYSAMQRYPEELRERKALAQIYLEKGERRKAISQYEEMLELGEQDPAVYLVLAEEYRRSGSPKRARELFIALSDYYAERAMWSKSASCLHQVLQMDPQDLELRQRLAEAFAQDGMRDKAVAEHLRIAQEYERQDRLDKALGQYESVRELDARNVRILGKIAECYSRQQNSSRAVPVFLEMMDVYRERGILSKAIEVAKLALQRFPRDIKLQETLAQIYVQRGMSAEALWMYRKLAEQEPGEPRYGSIISRLEKELGVSKAADRERKPVAEQASPRTPTAASSARSQAPTPSARMERRKSNALASRAGEPSLKEAVRAFRVGKYAKCLDVCRQIIPACSATSNMDTLLQTNALEARCLIKMGNTKEAIKTCMQALSIGGIQQDRALEIRYLLGVSLESDGQQDQALAVYKKVLQVDPNYADVKSRMAWARMGTKANSRE